MKELKFQPLTREQMKKIVGGECMDGNPQLCFQCCALEDQGGNSCSDKAYGCGEATVFCQDGAGLYYC